MREVINISLPAPLVKTVKSAVKKGNYASTSEFFRYLLRDWQAEMTRRDLKESKTEIAAGKGKTLKSLKNLR